MATVPVAIRGWWRYSQLRPRQLVLALSITVMVWVVTLANLGRGPLSIVAAVGAGAVTVLASIPIAHGAIRAHRARRHGCW